MRGLRHRLQRELSAFELIVSVILILVLAVVFVHKALALLADAERSHMTTVLNRARSSIMLEALTRFVRGDHEGLAALQGSNPMRTMDAPPRNYIGELRFPRPEIIDGGAWYFDSSAKRLVYRVEHEDGFHTSLAGPKRARFQVRLRYRDANGNRSFDPAVDDFEGIALEAVEAYRWVSSQRRE